MPAGMWFWVIYILALLLGGLGYFGVWAHGFAFSGLVLVVLLGLLGWKVFGKPVQ